VVSDYVHSRFVKSAAAILIMLLSLIFAGIGFKAIIGGW
jgi:succinate dehydrogenase hydrophobic anchor subunit